MRFFVCLIPFFTCVQDWGYLFALYFVLLAIRTLMVALCSLYLRNYGHGLTAKVCDWPTFLKNMFVVSWGGLRGAVGLVLALAVNANSGLRAITTDPLYADRCVADTHTCTRSHAKIHACHG